MGIIGVLILSLGALRAAYGSKCIPETEVCSPYWVKMEPHKNLMESEEELNSWCRKQSLFIKCLEDVLLGKYGNYSDLPTNMLVSKMFSEDLCLEGSTNRKRYLDNAACINQLDMDFCTLPEYLEIVTPDGSVPPTKCSLADKSFSCVAATIVIKCGFDAGKIYRSLLKAIKYSEEICGVENAERAICDEAPDSEDELSGIYYGLVHRFGSIPEQVTEADSMDETESIYQSDESIISEAIKKALINIDYSEDVGKSERSNFEKEAMRNEDESRKWPVISEQFKGLLFYNYSNEVFEFYWRQPGSFPIERVTCEHVLSPHVKGVTFECIVNHRFKEPECYYDTKPTTKERITPELIRDIDITIPEDSALDISEGFNLTDYLPNYQRYRMSWIYFIGARLVVRLDSMRALNRYLEVQYPSYNVCAKELRFYDIINYKDIFWWQCPSLFSDELRNEIFTFFFGKKTVDDVLFLSVFNENDKSYVHLYEPMLHAFDKVVCERVNECHPRGRGVFKCSLKRRDLEGCNFCCYSPKDECKARLERKEAERRSSSKTFQDTEEGSGDFEDASEHFSDISNQGQVDEATTGTEETTNFVIGENGDLLALDLSEMQTDSKSESTSDVNLVFLSQNSDAIGENAFFARSGVLSISDDETPYDRSDQEFELSNGNILVLPALPSIGDFEPAYEIVAEDALS